MINVTVAFDPSQGGPRQILGYITLTNDGTASDGSGDAPIGNYTVAQYDARGKCLVDTHLEGFQRRQGWRALLRKALEALETPAGP